MTPVLNTATPIMSNSELTTKAKLNWILESQVENEQLERYLYRHHGQFYDFVKLKNGDRDYVALQLPQ